MEPFHSSEVSTLVFRYLISNGFQDAATAFLKESPDMNSMRSTIVYGSHAPILGGLADILYDYGKTKLLVRELTVNLITKWKALQEDTVSPCDTLTTQLRHINTLLSTMYTSDKRNRTRDGSDSPSPIPPRFASVIRTKRVAGTCTSEDNMPQDVFPSKVFSTISTQTELPETSCVFSTISTQTEPLETNCAETQTQDIQIVRPQLVPRDTVCNGTQTNVDDMMQEIKGTVGEPTTGGIQSSQQNTPISTISQTESVSPENVDESEELENMEDATPLTVKERGRIQFAFLTSLLHNNEAQERLANTCTQHLNTGTGSEGMEEQIEDGAPAALSANAEDVLECLLRDFDLMDGADSQDAIDMGAVNSLSSDRGINTGNNTGCVALTGKVVEVIHKSDHYAIDIREPEIPEHAEAPEAPEDEDSEPLETLEQPPEAPERPETPPIIIDIADSPQPPSMNDGVQVAQNPPVNVIPVTLPPKKNFRKRSSEFVKKRRQIPTNAFPDGADEGDIEIAPWSLLGRRGITPKIPSVVISAPESQTAEASVPSGGEDTPDRLDRLKTAEAVQNIPNVDDESRNSLAAATPHALTPAPQPVVTPIMLTSNSKKLESVMLSSLLNMAQKISESHAHVSIAKPIVLDKKSYSTPRKKNRHVRNLQFTTPPSLSKVLHSIDEEELRKSGSLDRSLSRKRPFTSSGGEPKSKKRLEWTETVPETVSEQQLLTSAETPVSVQSRRVSASALDSPEAESGEIVESYQEADPQPLDYTIHSDEQEGTDTGVDQAIPLRFHGNTFYATQLVDGSLISFPVKIVPTQFDQVQIQADSAVQQMAGSHIFNIPNPESPVHPPPVPMDSTVTSPILPPDTKQKKRRANPSPRTLEHYEQAIQNVIKSGGESESPSSTKPTNSPNSGRNTVKKKGKERIVKRPPKPKSPTPKPKTKPIRVRVTRKSEQARLKALATKPILSSSETESSSPTKKCPRINVENISLPPAPYSVETILGKLPQNSTGILMSHDTITLCQGDISQPPPSDSPPLPTETIPVKPPLPAESHSATKNPPNSVERKLRPRKSIDQPPPLPKSVERPPRPPEPDAPPGSHSKSGFPIQLKATERTLILAEYPVPNPNSAEPVLPYSNSKERPISTTKPTELVPHPMSNKQVGPAQKTIEPSAPQPNSKKKSLPPPVPGGETPIWNPSSNCDEESLAKRPGSDESSSGGPWVAPATPRFLRRGDTVSDWDSPGHSMSSVGGVYETMSYGAYTGFYSLMTPVKAGDIPLTPGRSALIGDENSSRASIFETPNLDHHKRMNGLGPGQESELNTPIIRTHPNSPLRLPAPVPVPVSVPQPQPVPVVVPLPAPVTVKSATAEKDIPPSTNKDTSLKMVLKTIRDPSNTSAPKFVVQQSLPAAAEPKGLGLMKFKVGGREKRLTMSKPDSVYTLLVNRSSANGSIVPSPVTKSAKPVATENVDVIPAPAKPVVATEKVGAISAPAKPLTTENIGAIPAAAQPIPAENVGTSRLQSLIRGMNLDRFLQKVHKDTPNLNSS